MFVGFHDKLPPCSLNRETPRLLVCNLINKECKYGQKTKKIQTTPKSTLKQRQKKFATLVVKAYFNQVHPKAK